MTRTVAFLHSSNDLYGASRILVDDVRIFRANGYEIRVVLPTEGPLTAPLEAAGAEVHIEPLRVLRRVASPTKLRVPLQLPAAAAGSDLVVLSTLALMAYGPALRLRRKRVVASILEILESRAGSALARFAVATAPAIITVSDATTNWLLRHGGQRRSPVTAYPVAPSYAPLPPIPYNGEFRLLLAGRVNGHKGHDEAVQAGHLVRERGVDLRLDLLGGPYPGQEVHLERLKEALRSAPWATYGGEVPDIRPHLAANHALLVPTTKPEPFGIVALEAWAAGRRIIASNEGGLAEATDMVEGIKFAPRDIGSMADAITRVAQDPELRGQPRAEVEAAVRCTLEAREGSWRKALQQVDVRLGPG